MKTKKELQETIEQCVNDIEYAQILLRQALPKIRRYKLTMKELEELDEYETYLL